MEALLLLVDKQERSGDDFCDKMSSKYSVFLLCIFALISTTRLYMDEPISCFCPAEWTSSEVAFAEKTCWTQNTFYVSSEQDSVRQRHSQVSYYQWMSLIFALQAFLFFMPSCLWKISTHSCGLDSVTDACWHSRRTPEDNSKAIEFASKRLLALITSFHTVYNSRIHTFMHCRRLSVLFLCVKCAYVVNAVGQLYLLDFFLDNDYPYYGFRVFRRMFNGQAWSKPHSFPRVTFCDVMERALGNKHQHTIQCTLPMNLYYEMMLLLLWLWLVVVAAVAVCSLLKWIVMLLFSSIRYRHLTQLCASLSKEEADVRSFMRYLSLDGFLVMKLVCSEAGDSVAVHVSKQVWLDFLAIKSKATNASEFGMMPKEQNDCIEIA